jgi:SAM-dependent methyltransferase
MQNEHNEATTHERRFHGAIDRLRSPHRLARLQVPGVVDSCIEGIAVANVLDVGTGSGVFAEAFAARGVQVTGIDANAEMLHAARQFVTAAQFRQAPAEAIPFPDASFDLVFLGHVLHETDDAVKALQEARRVARARVAVLEWPYRDEEEGPPLAHRLTPEQVAALARQAGWSDIETIPLAHMVLYRLPISARTRETADEFDLGNGQEK